MHRAVSFLLFVIAVVPQSVVVAGPVVDQWGLGTNGVHSSPVFKFKPEIRWSFDGNATAGGFVGIIPLNNDEKTLYISQGSSGNDPDLWKMTWDGEIVMQYSQEGTCSFDGTISVRNGVIYIYNDLNGDFYAIDETNQAILWTANIPTSDYSTGPVVWNSDESYFAFASQIRVAALNASNGAVLWQIPIDYEFSGLPMVYSKLDDALVWVTNTQEIVKVSMKTGTEIWRNTDMQFDPRGPVPLSVAIDDEGNIYGGMPSTNHVYKVNKDGTKIWATVVDNTLAYSSTVLTQNWLFIIDNQQGAVVSVNAENGTAYFAYANDDTNSGTYLKWITGQVFWNQNVLYGSFQSIIAAYDTSDPTNVTQLWTIDTGLVDSNSGGISIAADGTLFLAGTMYDAKIPFLVSIGCPIGLHLKPDGTDCVQCYAGYVLNGGTCEKCQQGFFSNDGDAQCTACTEDPNNPQCALPPAIVAPIAEPVANAPLTAEVPVQSQEPVASPIKPPTSKTASNSATKFLGTVYLIFSLLVIML